MLYEHIAYELNSGLLIFIPDRGDLESLRKINGHNISLKILAKFLNLSGWPSD